MLHTDIILNASISLYIISALFNNFILKVTNNLGNGLENAQHFKMSKKNDITLNISLLIKIDYVMWKNNFKKIQLNRIIQLLDASGVHQRSPPSLQKK